MNEQSKKWRRIYIELTDRCNMRCSFCPRSKAEGTGDDMPLPHFKALIDDIAANIPYSIVYLHYLGEPLLYPRLPEALAYCDEHGVRAGLTTNGLLLQQCSAALATSTLDQINVSYQGGTETFMNERLPDVSAGAYLHAVSAGISEVREKGFKGTVKLKLMTTGPASYFSGSKYSNIETPEAFSLAVRGVYSSLMGRPMTGDQARLVAGVDCSSHYMYVLANKLIVETCPFTNWGNWEQGAWPAFFGICDGIDAQMVIRRDGTLLPCCNDIGTRLNLGNCFEKPLSALLASREAKVFSGKLRSRRMPGRVCRKCKGDLSFWTSLKRQAFALANIPESNSVTKRIVL